MPIHLEVLRAAQDLCSGKGNWRFRLIEIVRRLPHLNPATVRTHVSSRCCVNAPANHLHRWGYFERVGHGEFEIRIAYRKRPKDIPERVAFVSAKPVEPITIIHAVVTRGFEAGKAWYTAKCFEVAVVTQGRTLDEVAGNLDEAVRLHLEGDASALGMAAASRITLIYEMAFPSS